MALMWDELPGGGVVKVKAKAKQAQPRRQMLLLDPAAIAVMARRGLVRVNVVKLAQVSKVSRPTIERWLRMSSSMLARTRSSGRHLQRGIVGKVCASPRCSWRFNRSGRWCPTSRR